MHLALMTGKPDLLPVEADTSHDPDIAFCVLLATGNIEKLTAAQQQGDRLKAYAATFRLCRMGHFQGTSDVILRVSDAQRAASRGGRLVGLSASRSALTFTNSASVPWRPPTPPTKP